MTIDLFGLGALNRDYLYRVTELVIDGEATVEGLTVSSGGSAANTCRTLARWGISVGLGGAVGDDADGWAMLADLRASGVGISAVVVKPGVPTGRVLGLVDPQGRRSLYVMPGANDCLSRSNVDLEAIGEARLAHLTSFVGQAQLALQEWLAGELPPSVALSFSPGQLYARLGRERLASILGRTTILFVNRAEAELLGGVERLRQCGCPVIVQTAGEEGCWVFHSEGEFHAPAYPTAVRDTTGAGDAFAAGFLFGWLRAKPLETCARWGNWTASRVIQAAGANSNLPPGEELEDLR